MHKYFCSWLLFFTFNFSVAANNFAFEPAFKNEILKYKLKYLNLKVADLEFSVTDSSCSAESTARLLTICARSTSSAGKLFYVNNIYQVNFISANFLPLKIEKNIDQKNIRHLLTIQYDRQKLTATKNDSLTWSIPEPCYDYFTMLYFLRSQTLNFGDTLNFYLDSEYLISKVRAVVQSGIENIKVPAGKFAAIRLELSFQLITEAERPWKTDLLTNRLAAPGSKLTLWLSNDEKRIPLKISYHNSLSKTELLLYSSQFGE